ncbi:hypothetical protein [Dactylosporangium sp. NPDC048998]|uniref:phosphoribosylanthranilate isomerase n=1 Tax=Dactylosporangium sp. NPDC048998 TaxID=3363976 RepID=UPI00371C9021
MRIKVCGARSRADVRLLAGAGADLVGLWHGVPGGHAELPLDIAADLTRRCLATGGTEPVLVTFVGDPDRLARIVGVTGVRWVQLHAYQQPGVVKALKTAAPVTVVKVLHIRDGICLEERFIGAYERAGTDLFLLDTVSADGRVGSTGRQLAAGAALALAARLQRPFLLAGGLCDTVTEQQAEVAAHPLFHGVDVDTAARDADGEFAAARVEAITRCWRAAVPT